MNFTAFIFARGGSKGVRDKNIREVGGKPLISYAISCALGSKYINKIIVSTNSKKIARIATKHGAEILIRPNELAEDDTPEILAWRHAIKTKKDIFLNQANKIFISVPVTSPMRKHIDIDNAISRFQKGGCDIVFGVTPSQKSPYLNMVRITKNDLIEVVLKGEKVSRRQDVPDVYDITTCVYVTTTDYILNCERLVDGRVGYVKIPSSEITNLPYLRHIGGMGKPIILSTGMSTLEEVCSALNILLDSGAKKEQITIMHCNTEYPTPMRDVNLKAMLTIGNELGVSVGYSDHTLGIEVPIAAVAIGATVIEKHFTLDRTLPGPDHAASLEPYELKEMVCAIRNIEKAMGNGIKKPSPSEIKNISIARKSIVAEKSITKGELFTEENLTIKRPGTGISPMLWDNVIGQKAKFFFKPDDPIVL